MKRTITAVLALGLIMTLAGVAQAAVGDILSSAGWTTREGVTSGWPSNTGIKAINGDGLNGLYHDPGIYDNWGPVWFTQINEGNQWINTFSPGRIWLMVDMQEVQTIGTINVWNFGDPASHPAGFNLGAKNVDIYYAGDGATLPTAGAYLALDGTWTTLMNVDLNPAPTNGAPSLMSDSLDVTDFDARYVIFAINSRFGSNDYSENSVAIAEIQFLQGAVGDIPEPATMSLLAIGSLAAVIRRRR
ncbi:MAG: PEP-CTERM sorting domain-containing protein [Planctomycetaceae bacterium]|nr:PEP-CTERM sorting domain-containing protein [Planctomycetaceae bacterium]